jgi:DNA polymerase IV
MRRVLYLWVPHLHTAVERLLSPGLAGQPLVITSGSFARGVVVDASPEAEALGVGVGQSWRHARRHAPTATFIPYETWRIRPFTERIGDLLHELTPWVETLPGSEEEFFADLGAGPLEEGDLLARGAVAAVRETLALEAHAGLATGKLVARTTCRCWALGVGHWALGNRPEHPTPSAQRPTPSTVPPGQERRFLRPLSLGYLWDMQPEHRRRLGPLGLRTFGQLAAVPQRLLVGQFGPVGRWYRLLASGIDARRVKPWSPHPSISSRLFIQEDEADLPLLDGYLTLLARRVSNSLIATGQYARVVSLSLEIDGARPFASHHLKAPTNLPAPIHRAARDLLVSLLQGLGVSPSCSCSYSCSCSKDLKDRVGARARVGAGGECDGPSPTPEALTLTASGLETRGLLQLSLFGDPDRGPALRAAIARIQDRFGEAAIVVGSGQWSVGSKGNSTRHRRTATVHCLDHRFAAVPPTAYCHGAADR